MTLQKVTLKNFRTCGNVELTDLGHLTVLMGRNGVGKTNILQGIEWLAQTASASKAVDTDPFSIGIFSISANPFLGQISFSVNGTSYRYTLKLNYSSGGIIASAIDGGVVQTANLEEHLERQVVSGKWRNVLERKDKSVWGADGDLLAEIHPAIPMLSAIISLKPYEYTKEDILAVQNYLRGVKYYPFDEVANPSNEKLIGIVPQTEYKKWLAQVGDSISLDDSVVMRLLHMYLDRRNDFDELKELLGFNGLGILSSIEVTDGLFTFDTYYFIRFQPGNGWEDVGLPSFAYEKLSSGTRRIIRILVSFFYDRNSVFLFEQPEDAIHPGLLRKLIDLLRGYNDKGQLIMTSHSSDLFNVLKPEEVRLVTMQGGATAIRALSEKELDSAKRYINEEGSLSDFLEMLEDY